MCNATHSQTDDGRAAAIARNCAECVRGRGGGSDYFEDPLGAVRRLTRATARDEFPDARPGTHCAEPA